MWRPQWVVRHGRGGQLASPTTTSAVILLTVWNLAIGGLMTWMVSLFDLLLRPEKR